ncbi:hypothetical protein [Streptomyces cacaoi]|uniref:hypothetical protein n=1 Tax=Streptomyces cacaoi TaxID=1898 RepID=UPI0011F1E479|nr:hypothetical protein [Streptomyces cacaoi]
MTEEFGNSIFERAWETPEEVVLRRELVRTPGLQPEDLGVLAELLLRDPRLPSTMEAIRKDLQERLGWKMGKDRYRAIADRLIKAGHMSLVPAYDSATQRPTWVTRVYRNPANNEQYVDLGITASMQVGSEMRETRNPAGEHSFETRETRVSAGQSRNAGNPPSGAESRETRISANGVSAGQSRNAENPPSGSPPPHPPEEVDTSSPLPPSDANGSLPSQREEGAAESFPEERLAEARLFLSRLPRPWTVGRQAARRMAPLLLEAAEEQGWQLDEKLAAELTRNPEGVRNYVRALERARIPDLVRYEMVHGPGASQFEGASPAQGSGRESAQVRALRARIAREGTGL